MTDYPGCDPNDPACITIESANKLMDQHEVIRDNAFATQNIIKRKTLFTELETLHSDENLSFKNLYRKLINFFNFKSNIYIFEFKKIQELINESVNDPDGKATHIMFIDGSQQQADATKGFKMGQSTSIIVPCKKLDEFKDEDRFVSVGKKGREHPQTRFARTIPVKKGENKIEVHMI